MRRRRPRPSGRRLPRRYWWIWAGLGSILLVALWLALREVRPGRFVGSVDGRLLAVAAAPAAGELLVERDGRPVVITLGGGRPVAADAVAGWTNVAFLDPDVLIGVAADEHSVRRWRRASDAVEVILTSDRPITGLTLGPGRDRALVRVSGRHGPELVLCPTDPDREPSARYAFPDQRLRDAGFRSEEEAWRIDDFGRVLCWSLPTDAGGDRSAAGTITEPGRVVIEMGAGLAEGIVAPDGARMAAVGRYAGMALIDLEEGTWRRVAGGTRTRPRFAPDASWLATVAGDRLEFWSLDGRRLGQLRVTDGQAISDFALLGERSLVLAVGDEIEHWRLERPLLPLRRRWAWWISTILGSAFLGWTLLGALTKLRVVDCSQPARGE